MSPRYMIAFGHHVRGFKDRVGNLGDRETLVEGLLGRDSGRIRGQHEVDARVGDQVGLEFCHIDVQGSIETKRGRERTNDLRDQTVQVGVA